MNERNGDTLAIATERYERRLAEECGKLRVEMAEGFGAVRAQIAGDVGGLRSEIGALRAEMIDRNTELLKWVLAFLVAQTAAVAALLMLFR